MKRFSLIMLICSLTGCAVSNIAFEKEELTGESCLVIRNVLSAEKNCSSGVLKLKSFENEQQGTLKYINAQLELSHKGQRDYNINPDEQLFLNIDGIPYPLNVSNAVKTPNEEVGYYGIPLPTGRAVTFGYIKEITYRKIAFLLSGEIIDKLSQSKNAYFEITPKVSSQSNATNSYPIILKFEPENIELLQEFNTQCRIAFPTTKE